MQKNTHIEQLHNNILVYNMTVNLQLKLGARRVGSDWPVVVLVMPPYGVVRCHIGMQHR